MQANGEADANTCAYNDLALVKIDPADVGKVNPSIPFLGGPTGSARAAPGDKVFSLRQLVAARGITQLSPKEGIVAGTTGRLEPQVYTVTPGIPGDSG